MVCSTERQGGGIAFSFSTKLRDIYTVCYGNMTKEDETMVLFTSLLVTLIACTIFAAIFLITGSAAFIVVFGDVLVFGLIVWLIIKYVKKHRK